MRLFWIVVVLTLGLAVLFSSFKEEKRTDELLTDKAGTKTSWKGIYNFVQEELEELRDLLHPSSETSKTINFDPVSWAKKTDQKTNLTKVKNNFGKMIRDSANYYGIDTADAYAIVCVESGANPKKINKSGATGLFQVMPASAAKVGVTGDLTDPLICTSAAMRHLKKCLDMFDGDREIALIAYNNGEYRIDLLVKKDLFNIESYRFHKKINYLANLARS